MPKKSTKDSGESKKRRVSSSAKDARNSSATSPVANDLLLPPTPTATHLVASNPFDDPPSSNSSMLLGPSRMLMHSPINGAGMRSPTSMQMVSPHGPGPGWGSGHPASLRGMRPYGSPGPPNWNPNSSEMMSPGQMMPGYQGMPMHHSPGMSPQAYNYNRPMLGHPSPGPHQLPYRSQVRMQANRFGEMSPPMNPDRMPVPRMAMHGMAPNVNAVHMPVPSQMKILTRPGPPATQNAHAHPPPPTRKPSTSGKSESKYSRNDGGTTTPKSKKKLKSAESKSANKLSSNNDLEEKNSRSSLSRTNSKSRLHSPGGSGVTPPHAIPPILPQNCLECCQEIKYPAEDCICCLASCNTWYHRTCAGLTEAAYNCLKSEELALWACDNCLRTKEIHSVRLREPVRPELQSTNVGGNLPITGKA